MAFNLLALSPFPTTTRLSPGSKTSMGAYSGGRFSQSVPCMAINTPHSDQTIARRVADYDPPIWKHDYLQSLTSTTNFEGDTYKKRADMLKEEVGMMLNKVEEPLDQLELVDTVQRLGLSYHFEVEIKKILGSIYNNDRWNSEDLYATALKFRLLRQHGYDVPQDVFNKFKDEYGNFKACICKDTKGMLYLYEASYLSIRGESIMDDAKDFTSKHLNEYLQKNKMDQNDVAILVSHALEIPLHWRMLRLEARWFIDVYERRPDVNTTLIEFAKLDFNMVQAIHQEDVKHMSRWWKSTCLGEKISFARDRLMESFFWTVGVIFEPQFQYCRRMLTKLGSLITTIDDVYDVYGTLDELELFTNAIERWDINAMEQLPDYMKICFLALYNSVNEIAYVALKEQNADVVSYLKNAWIDLFKSYLLEAKWYYSGYTPTLEEYIETAWISISAPALLVHAYVFVSNPIKIDDLECLKKYPNMIRWSSTILRLADDLGTSQDEIKRGDNPKAIQCYMHDTGASEEDARAHIKYLISENWKRMNEDRVTDSPFSQIFIGIAMNAARMSQCMYEHGDGYGMGNLQTKDRILSLITKPISLDSLM